MNELFKKEIEELKNSLLKMTSIVDEQIEKAIRGIDTGDVELIYGMRSKDAEVDLLDNTIKTQCENIFALFQPVASDLRFLMSVLLINNQLERCGDIAVNIAHLIKKTKQNHELIIECRINEMGKGARDMVKDAINSFLNLDISLAEKVISADSQVDISHKEIFKYIINKMQEGPALVEAGAHLIILTKNIERLADHATNIAEQTIFYKNAVIIAHKEKLERFDQKD